jgi:hypothetical protein
MRAVPAGTVPRTRLSGLALAAAAAFGFAAALVCAQTLLVVMHNAVHAMIAARKFVSLDQRRLKTDSTTRSAYRVGE